MDGAVQEIARLRITGEGPLKVQHEDFVLRDSDGAGRTESRQSSTPDERPVGHFQRVELLFVRRDAALSGELPAGTFSRITGRKPTIPANG